MPSKTDDIEAEIALALADGPLTLTALESGGRFAWLDDRRWLGSAIGNMIRDGRVKAGCDWWNHSHSDGCVIEAVAR